MAERHTPGPWRTNSGGGVYGAGDRFIGLLSWHAADPAARASDEANGRLIALAPQMYRALRGIVQDIQSREDWRDQIGYRISGQWWDMAVDAVNRVEQDR